MSLVLFRKQLIQLQSTASFPLKFIIVVLLRDWAESTLDDLKFNVNAICISYCLP